MALPHFNQLPHFHTMPRDHIGVAYSPKMTYICINDDISLTHPDKTGKTRVTNGKFYNGEEYDVGIRVTNDDGERETFNSDRFMRLRDYNLEKLEID